MDIKRFREIINQRENTDNEWSDEIEKCWAQEIEVLSEDIPSTIEFLRSECTASEFSWISEVIEEIVKVNPDKELVQCYKSLLLKFPDEGDTYHIIGSTIDNLEAIIRWKEENEKK